VASVGYLYNVRDATGEHNILEATVGTWIADLHYSMRRLAARPGYALLAVMTLALGIGGTAAAYGVARGILFDPLPYAHARDIGTFWKKTDWTEEEFLFVRGRVPGFAQVALYRQRDVLWREDARPARLMRGIASSAELFDVLGVRPVLGRGLQAGDDVPGAERVAILSYGLWQELGGSPSILGTRVTFDGAAHVVVGVMPRGFWFPDPNVRAWMPVPLSPEGRNWNSTLVGRVTPGLDVRAMDAPVAQLTAMLDERFDYPAQWDKTKDARITPLRDDLTGPMQPALLSTLGAMGLILLIACANVAALMLGQVNARSTEFAVRAALGANRRRLTQPLIAEALLIAVVAGVLGAVLAWAGFTVIVRALPLGVWREFAAPDWQVFASAMVIAVASALVVMLVPTISLYRGDLRGLLSRVRTGGIEGRGGRLENSLVIAEVALAVMIAAGAALLGRSVANLYDVDPGLRTDGVAVVEVVLGPGNRARLTERLNLLSSTVGELPGVHSVGVVQTLPLSGGGYNLPLAFDDRPDLKGLTTEYRMVTPGYLEAAGFTLRQGRTISADDRADTQRVVVINEAFARQYFAGVDPIGKLIGGDLNTPSRVVGVVANVVERHLTDPVGPVRYVPIAQLPWVDGPQALVVRAAAGVDETLLLEPIRQALARVAPIVAVRHTTTMSRVLDTAIGPARQVVVLLSVLAALALTLGAVGVYGVIAHFAARRRRDWAIRVALGLPGTRVIAHVVTHGALLVIAGIALGVAGAAVLTRLLSSFLYGVSAIDPLAFAIAAATLLFVGVLAALVPAWRAGMTDPVIALREP
jgi:putative ABC transport system permease protein